MGRCLQPNPEACLGTGFFTAGVSGWGILFFHLFVWWALSLNFLGRRGVRWPWWAPCRAWHRLHHGQSPRRTRVQLLQCRQSAESWGPAQQRGGRIISLFLLLLPLSPSSDFTGSYDLRTNPTHKGTQLPWAPPLVLLVVLPAGPEPNRLHKGAAGGRSLLALIVHCLLKRHGRARRTPLLKC